MSAVAVEQIQLIDLEKLEVHPANPRKDVGNIDELAASIKSAGLIEPIVAVRHNGKFQVVAGSRRLAAARKAKIESLPVRVMELAEAEARAAALIENLQRKDLNAIEEAEAFRGWLDLTGKTQKELGETVGLAPSTIANALRLLDTPKIVQDGLRKGEITAGHARVLLELKDLTSAGEALKQARDRMRTEHVTVSELKFAVDGINQRYQSEGAPAIAKIKAFYEEAKAAHPKATITWGRDEYGYSSDRDVTVKALGKAPAKIQGHVHDVAKHKRTCGCDAYSVVRSFSYSGNEDERMTLRLEHVCIDAKGWKKFNPSGRVVDRYNRPKSKAQREKEMQAEAEKAVASVHRYHRYSPKETAVHTKVVKHRDIDRVVLMALADHMSAPSYTYFAWQAVKKLSPAQVRARIKFLAAQKVLRGAGSYGSKRTDRGMEAVLTDLKIAPADLGYTPNATAAKSVKS